MFLERSLSTLWRVAISACSKRVSLLTRAPNDLPVQDAIEQIRRLENGYGA